jgi:cobalamin biosynthesis protein CobD/CbiB
MDQYLTHEEFVNLIDAILIILVYVIVECIHIISTKESFVIKSFTSVIEIVRDMSRELGSDKEGKIVCGYALAFIIIFFCVAVIYTLHASLVHFSFFYIFIWILVLITVVNIILYCAHYVNRKYISWCNKKRL